MRSHVRRLYLVGNAHIDPVWLWGRTDGLAEIKATFRAAVDRLKEFEAFVFTCAGASYYQWVEENEPKLFRDIQEMVRQKRWIIVGGWWLQPDCNLPCGESFVRHGLYGQRYFLEKFGVLCRVGYNVDSFGHNGMIPQLLKKSGMDSYVFMRPGPHEKDDIEKSLFWWEAPDGSRVLTFRIPFSYNSSFNGSNHNDREKLPAVLEIAEQEQRDLMYFFGVGNHGGGPTIRALQELTGLREELMDRAELQFSSPPAFFDDMGNSSRGLQIVTTDLQHHASGCYSANAEIKRNNRRAETQLVFAEAMGVLAESITDHVIAADPLKEAWKCVLWNQFHDIMGGCCIKAAYEDARALHGKAIALATDELNAAVHRMSWAIDTAWVDGALSKEDSLLWERSDAGIPLVVFNPHGWIIRADLEVNAVFTGVEDPQGRPVPVQPIRGPYTNKDKKRATLVSVDLPAWGYRVFRAFSSQKRQAVPSTDPVRAGDTYLENRYLRVDLDDNGNVGSIADKVSGTQYVASSGSAFVVIDETHCDTWAHGVFTFDDEAGQFVGESGRRVENGPVRARVRVTQRFAQSSLTLDYSLAADGRALTVDCRLLWLEKHRMLKFYLPVGLTGPEALYSMPFGCIGKSADGQEEPAQKWVLLRGKTQRGQPASIALINRDKHSFSANGATLTMTTVRSPQYADHYGERDDLADYMDLGAHDFSFQILPLTEGEGTERVIRAAEQFNTDPAYVIETYHKGSLPLECEGIRVSPAPIITSALKKAEDGTGYVVRCYETVGKKTDASIRLPLLDREWTFTAGPFEIKTFLVPCDPDVPVHETNLLEFDEGG